MVTMTMPSAPERDVSCDLGLGVSELSCFAMLFK